MDTKTLKAFFWVTTALAIVILPLNFGLGLFALAIPLIGILTLHIFVGGAIDNLQNHKLAIIISSINLLIFALIRPDGAHVYNGIGLTSLLDLFAINTEFDLEYETQFLIISLVMLIVQLVCDVRLRSIAKRS